MSVLILMVGVVVAFLIVSIDLTISCCRSYAGSKVTSQVWPVGKTSHRLYAEMFLFQTLWILGTTMLGAEFLIEAYSSPGDMVSNGYGSWLATTSFLFIFSGFVFRRMKKEFFSKNYVRHLPE